MLPTFPMPEPSGFPARVEHRSPMKAAVLTEYGGPLEILDVDDPVAGPGQVVVDVRATGVCGSDLFLQKGGFASTMPIVPGHEASGTVSEVGPGVESVKPGQPVALYYIDYCGACRTCQVGRVNMCLSVRRMGVEFDGAFAERVVISEKSVIPVEPGDDPAAIAVLTDAVATPYHGLTQIAQVRDGETVVVFGIGGLGSNAVQLAAHLGCQVIAVSRSQEKLDLAKRMGAHSVIKADDDIVDQVLAATGPGGPGVIVQTVGSAQVYEQAMAAAGIGCRILAIGSSLDAVPVVPMELIWREASFMGSRGFTPDDIREVIQLHRGGAISTEHLLQNQRPLEEVNHALDQLREGKVLRSILTFGEGW